MCLKTVLEFYIFLMERILLPCALMLHMLFSFDTDSCNFAASLKKALFYRTLITHTSNLTVTRVN